MNKPLARPPTREKALLSVVVPLLNEEEVIRLTHARITDMLGQAQQNLGSRDRLRRRWQQRSKPCASLRNRRV